MPKEIILLLVLFPLFSLKAQDWKPINGFEKYNYSNPVNTYSSIWADSIGVTNNDSVFYLNRTLKKVKDGDSLSSEIGYYLENLSQFFLSKLICKSNGDVSMEDENGKKYLIKTKANIGEQWLFDSLNSDTAEIVQSYTRTVFGNTDSVKIILLSGTDSIILSKNYGILKFPLLDSVNQYFGLAGIEGRNLGVVIPTFNDFYNFESGDIFYYKYQKFTHWYDYIIYKKIEILNKEISGDTIRFHTNYHSKIMELGHVGLSGDTSYVSINDSVFVYINNSNHFLNKYSGQILNNGITGMNYKPVIVSYDSEFNVLTKSYPYNPYCKQWDSDTIMETYNLTYCTFEGSTVISGETIGVIFKSTYIHNLPYPDLNENESLIGYMRNGIIYGTVPDNFLSLSVPEFHSSYFKIYPNPSSDIITLDCNDTHTGGAISIYNAFGQLVRSEIVRNNQQQLNVGNLNTGMYWVEIKTEGWSEIQKLIIQSRF